MIIKIAGLSEGVHKFSFEEPVNNLELSYPFVNNLNVDAELQKIHNQIILKADIRVIAEFECDRCTRNFNKEISTSFELVYMFGNEVLDTDDPGVVYLPYEADKINISAEVRDYTLLAVPMKKLCIDECKGLCARCGKDLNEENCICTEEEADVKWLPLMELKKKLNNN